MAREQGVERAEVALFLLGHVAHEWAEMRVGFQNGRCLGGVDEDCGQFAGLVDAEGGGEVFFLPPSKGDWLRGMRGSCGVCGCCCRVCTWYNGVDIAASGSELEEMR